MQTTVFAVTGRGSYRRSEAFTSEQSLETQKMPRKEYSAILSSALQTQITLSPLTGAVGVDVAEPQESSLVSMMYSSAVMSTVSEHGWFTTPLGSFITTGLLSNQSLFRTPKQRTEDEFTEAELAMIHHKYVEQQEKPLKLSELRKFRNFLAADAE